jgi:hypothetical protein
VRDVGSATHRALLTARPQPQAGHAAVDGKPRSGGRPRGG